MKKSFLPFALVLIAALTFFACSKKTGETSANVSLTVWESDNGPDLFIQQAGEAYTKLHPEVTIKYVHMELGDASGQIALDGPAGVGPDLFAAPHDKLGELVNSGHIAPTLNPEEIQAMAIPTCSKALTYKGTMYGYPVSAETYALFYNKDLISENEVPTTWENLTTFAKAFNEANSGKYGFIMDVGSVYYTIVFVTANGNRIFGSYGDDPSTSNLNNANAVAGMTFFQNEVRSALNFSAADLSTTIADSAFSSGNAALYITGLWNVKPFLDRDLNFGVAPLPALPGENVPCASFSGTRAMCVSAYSEHQEEAAEFAKFLLSPEMQKLRFDITGAMPSVNVEVDSPYMPGFLEQLEYAFPMPSIPQMNAFWEAMNNASKNIWDGKDVQKELDAADAAVLGL